MKSGIRKATIALTLAALLAVSLAGSALARPLIDDIDSYSGQLEAIEGQIDADPADREPTHGYFVSEFASNFEEMVADLDSDVVDDLTKGQWISLFARWTMMDEMAPGAEWRGPSEAKRGAGAARAAEAKANRAQGDVEDDDIDEEEEDLDDQGDGRTNAPGLQNRSENPGAANMPVIPGNAPDVEEEEEEEDGSQGGPPDWLGSGPPQAGDAAERGQSGSQAPR